MSYKTLYKGILSRTHLLRSGLFFFKNKRPINKIDRPYDLKIYILCYVKKTFTAFNPFCPSSTSKET